MLQKGVGLDLGARGDREVLRKRLAIDVGAEVFDVRNGAGLRAEIMAAVQDDVLAALVSRGYARLPDGRPRSSNA